MKCFHPFQTKSQAKVAVTTEVHGAQGECSGAQAVGQAVGQALTSRHESQAAVPKGARKSVAWAPSGTVKVS